MLEGGRVDGLELQSFAVIDIHWNGIALEQQAERRFALLHFRDVDANADRAAVARAAFVDHDPTSVGEPLLVTLTGIGQQSETLADPFFLVSDRVGIVAAADTDAQRIRQARARPE